MSVCVSLHKSCYPSFTLCVCGQCGYFEIEMATEKNVRVCDDWGDMQKTPMIASVIKLTLSICPPFFFVRFLIFPLFLTTTVSENHTDLISGEVALELYFWICLFSLLFSIINCVQKKAKIWYHLVVP